MREKITKEVEVEIRICDVCEKKMEYDVGDVYHKDFWKNGNSKGYDVHPKCAFKIIDKHIKNK